MRFHPIPLAVAFAALPTLVAAGQAVDPNSPSTGKIVRSQRDFDRQRVVEPSAAQGTTGMRSSGASPQTSGFSHAGEQDATGLAPTAGDAACVPSASIQCIGNAEPSSGGASGVVR